MIGFGIPKLDKEFEGIDNAIILAGGVPGSGKEVLAYHLIRKCLEKGVKCIFATSSRNSEQTIQDLEYYDMDGTITESVTWIDTFGASEKENVITANINELFTVSTAIKNVLYKEPEAQILIVLDILSASLMSNTIQQVYKFFSGLAIEFKKKNVTAYVLIERQMHESKDVVALEQLSDVVFEFNIVEEGAAVKQTMRIKKKMGRPVPLQSFEFTLTKKGLGVE